MRKFFIALIAITPINAIRVFLYRAILGYEIAPSAKIGLFNIINAKICKIGNARIGHFNYFDTSKIELHDDAYIGRFNRFKWLSILVIESKSSFVSGNVAVGTKPGVSPFKINEILHVGQSCVVTNRHLFDVAEPIILGNDVTIAGSGTQLWTHGFDLQHVKIQAGIKIGNNVYIGSRSMILQGVAIVDGVLVGAGTTVSRSIRTRGFYVSGLLERKADVPSYKSNEAAVVHNGFAFVRKPIVD